MEPVPELVAGAPPARGIGPREGLDAGLFWPRRAGDVGGPTAWQVRSARWRTTGWGLSVPAEVPLTARQRVVEASALWPGGVVTGWAALAWRGARWFEGLAPDGSLLPVDVHIGVGRGPRRQHQARPTQESVQPWAVERDHGCRVALPVWAVGFAMRHAPSLVEAVRVIDMAAYDDLVSIDEVARCAAAVMMTMTGVPQLREALRLASENSWSPQEPVMRCAWHLDAGRPMPLANRPVFDRNGRHVGTPDLLDVEAGVYGQYDGAAVHLVGAQRSTDIRQEAAYRELGLEGVTMVAGDLADTTAFARRLVEAYARAARRPAAERRWLDELPAWWTPTVTVAQRRALGEAERRRLLGYRRTAA
ncbi:hypothetical protein [Nocardioides currus]|uniref:AbiEi antitoxin C-terminal domain-containing protein n=1 Tax=Nocardioides currus TaxID=2133958 RepID=A0A2R7Z336_9ACTN|nr:hypothetical protein [Nocardioides currus]PUA83002.1 hypothetical protein C7S10_04805 [Nocardioides currus]